MAGWSDYYENYPSVETIANMTAAQHMAATQNALLEALGSSLRITDDATHDDALNGGQTQRLYFNAYNFDSFLVDGVEVDEEHPNDRMYTEVYSQYGGATIHVVDASGNPTSTVPGTVTPIVFGHSGTYSKDSDNDGIGGENVPKYTYAEGDDRLMVLASEQLEGKGLIIVSGAAFMSNFEVQATIEDSGSEKNYSNYKICENLLKYANPANITPIAEVQAQTEIGIKYTIEGIVTSNASGYDKDTAFFDCIYVQDETAGVCCFPVAGNYKIGDKVRVTGTTEFYQGEMELQVTEIELLSEGNEVTPKEVTAAEINDGSVLGSLITISGTVESYKIENGLVQTIMVKDAAGDLARVFIDGYITTSKDVENLAVGAEITVTGLASYDDTFNAPEGPFPRIRIRNRADVVVTKAACPSEKFEDLDPNAWYHEGIDVMLNYGFMKGYNETTFGPSDVVTRAQMVTLLWNIQGQPEPESTTCPFTDVDVNGWYGKAVLWACEEGITNGTSATTFAPNATLTREQMFGFLYNAAGKPEVSGNLDNFADGNAVSSWALNATICMVENGLVQGDANGKLNPKRVATRAELAVFFARLIEADTNN